jgi:hypothetical protein
VKKDLAGERAFSGCQEMTSRASYNPTPSTKRRGWQRFFFEKKNQKTLRF